jgi:hypothetical protein
MKEDARPPFILNDVKGIDFRHVKAQHAESVPTFDLKNVEDFSTRDCWPVSDMRLERVATKKL